MAKCQFCGTSNETVNEREDKLVLCNNCNEVRNSKLAETKMEEEKEMEKDKSKVVDIKEYEEVEDSPQEEKSDIKCEVILGVKEDGSLYFNAGGNSPDLLLIDGLLNFGKRRLKQIWEQRDAMQRAQMETEAQEEQTEE